MTTFRDMEKKIKKDGWVLDYIEGSHHHYKHQSNPVKLPSQNIPSLKIFPNS